MSRPRPTIIVSKTDKKHLVTEVLDGTEAVYVVAYNGRPINLRRQHTLLDSFGKKYFRTSFVGNSGHAFNLAERLNKLFSTTAFSVLIMDGGTRADEEEITGRPKR